MWECVSMIYVSKKMRECFYDICSVSKGEGMCFYDICE